MVRMLESLDRLDFVKYTRVLLKCLVQTTGTFV